MLLFRNQFIINIWKNTNLWVKFNVCVFWR